MRIELSQAINKGWIVREDNRILPHPSLKKAWDSIKTRHLKSATKIILDIEAE